MAAGVLFSNLGTSTGVFHLSAQVGGGEFIIDPLNPAASFNATIIETPRPIRYGMQYVSFTEDRSGNTSSFAELNLSKP